MIDNNPQQNITLTITSRKVALSAVALIGLLCCVLLIVWAQERDYRPLIQDIRLVDAVKIADILDQNKVAYKTDISSHMIFVAEDQNTKARIALARAGIEINYPPLAFSGELTQICNRNNETIELYKERPLWEQPWAMRALKLLMGGLVILVVILAIVRPALYQLLYLNEKD